MNIIFDTAKPKAAETQTNVDKATTSYRTPQSTGKVENSGFALDISGTVMDNSAYAGHGRTAEEVMLEAGQEDITARRNYMAVMSNSMSDEDFAKLQEEGFHPGSTEIETVVTIVDHIKAALVKGGAQVSGYTDTIDEESLKEIVGSETLAREMVQQFHENDLPITEESAALVAKAWDMLKEVTTLSQDSVKYMVENDRTPTPENLYTARFAAADGSNRQGKGYYADGSVAGYYARKPEAVDYEALLPQMEKVLWEAGYEATEENLNQAKWLVEKGIPLNRDTYLQLMEVTALSLPVSERDFLQAAACAVSEGKSPVKADLNQKESAPRQAVRILEETSQLSEETVDVVTARNLPLTLRNLQAAQKLTGTQEDTQGNIQKRRLLEEVRLSMTMESNLRLLRSGFQIETAPLEELVEALKAAEREIETTLTKETDPEIAHQKSDLYRETVSVLQEIRTAPLAVVAKVSEEDLLSEIQQKGKTQAATYEKAGQAYETLMTAPRKDMGDSISKAFRNVDDILEDLEMPATEASRRAVRILGYNEIEVTPEHIAEIEKKDQLLTQVVEGMKPERVLHMIREGVNPLSMPLEELSAYLNGQQEQNQDAAEDMESYSRFLYKLEQQKEISEEERSAYIGLYRLTRQLEKGDDAAVGALWQMGSEFTLENLLTVNRSMKRTHREYRVDESFGGVEATETGVEDIISQIQKGFAPEPEELQKVLEQAGSQEAEEEFRKFANEQVRASVRCEESVLRQLTDYSQPVTAENLQAMQLLMKSPVDLWKDMGRLTGGKSRQKQENIGRTEGIAGHADGEDGLEKLLEMSAEVTGALDGSEHAAEVYEGFTEQLKDILENRVFAENPDAQESIESLAASTGDSAMDIRAMSTLYKQMSFLSNLAREEQYEIPVNIGGELTSINLKILHKEDQESKVAVSMETESMGKVAAEFQVREEGLTGICICSDSEARELLDQEKASFKQKLEEEQISAGECYFATGEKLDLTEFSLKASQGREQGRSAGELYRAARAFIGFIQETAHRKEAEL